jgi:hypothetical protein
VTVRWLGATVLVALALGGTFVGQALTAGPGGWDHLGDGGTPGSDSLNLNVHALSGDAPGLLLVGGDFTGAAGNPAANKIASWNGSTWNPVGSASEQIANGGVYAITYANGKVYAGGTFTNAGGDADADFLAVWDGQAWAPFCDAPAGQPAFGGNVKALQVVGQTLYVGGEFQDGAGIVAADYLLACDLASGASRSTLADSTGFGPIEALAADSDGRLYAGGRFKIAGIPGAENVAYLDAGGAWHAMGSGPAGCQCAIDGFVRSLTAIGTDVYVGTDSKNVAGIAQADNVARWTGSEWRAVGANAAGADGWFPASTFIYALTSFDSKVFAAGSFQDAGGDPSADNVAYYDGSAWRSLGSNGAGNGPWVGEGHALAVFDRLAPATAPRSLVAGGSFTSAGGDTQANRVASFSLTAITPVPTPVPTPGAAPAPTPTPTPTPIPAAKPTPPPLPIPPVLESLRLSRTTFRAAPSGGPFRAARAAVGTDVSFRLSAPGLVRFTIDRSSTGRSVKGRCVKTSSTNRSRSRCTRWIAVKGSFTVKGKQGANRIELRGRIGGRTLKPGSYRLNARPAVAGPIATPAKRTAFKIVR